MTQTTPGMREATRHLIGRSYRSVGDCWQFAATVLSLFGRPWPCRPVRRGAARHAGYVALWERDFVRYDHPAPGRVVLLRTPKTRRVQGYPYRWHCGVMVDGRFFIHAAVQGVRLGRLDDMSYGPFVWGFYEYPDAGN